MTVSTSIEIAGLKEALRELQKIDKGARRDLTKRYREVVQPVIDEIQSNFPTKPPLSGFARSWDPGKKRTASTKLAKRDAWAAVLAQNRNESGANAILPWDYKASAVKAYVSGKKPRHGAGRHSAYISNLAVFTIRWSGPGARLFDIAGRGDPKTAKGLQMVASLTARFGKPSRLIWPSYIKHEADVIKVVQEICNDLMQRVNHNLDN